MDVRFVVPWRSDGTWHDDYTSVDDPFSRVALWAHCKQRWGIAFPSFPIVEGAAPDGPFNRSAAINDAARGDWDVAVVIDADVIVASAQVTAALALAESSGRVVFGQSRFYGLTPNMTARILGGYEGLWSAPIGPPWDVPGVRWMTEFHESSIVVVPRRIWDTVGGFDERFIGWGQEDVAFAQAVRVMCGEPARVDGPVWHLWHAHGVDRKPGSAEHLANQALGQRYRVTTTKKAMRALLPKRRVAA